MSSESIVTALFLISAVIAAGVLITAIFPAIYRTTETFGSVSHEADVQMRTDIKIVNYYYNPVYNSSAIIWLKNIGTARIGSNELDEADIFIGTPGNFVNLGLEGNYDSLTNTGNNNNFWDPGETLTVSATCDELPDTSGEDVYFAIVLSNGIRRSVEFPRE